MADRTSRPPLDDLFAAFAYRKDPTNLATPPKSSPIGDEKLIEDIPITSPNSVLPPSLKTKQKKKKKKNDEEKSEFEPSSHLLTTVNGETKVVSRYFDLPKGASPPVVLPQKDVHKAYEARKRKLFNNGHGITKKKQEKMSNGEEELDLVEKLRNYKPRKQRSVLSAKEKMMDVYKRVTVNNSWVPSPSSPFALLQERHCFDPWRVLIICMLLNITTGNQVKGVLDNLFLKCPTAESVMEVEEEELEQMLRPLGLQKKRARAIKVFSHQYLGNEWTHVTQLHGVGKYAADAYAIFCGGKAEEVIPQDNKLVDYWKFVCEHAEEQQQQLD